MNNVPKTLEEMAIQRKWVINTMQNYNCCQTPNCRLHAHNAELFSIAFLYDATIHISFNNNVFHVKFINAEKLMAEYFVTTGEIYHYFIETGREPTGETLSKALNASIVRLWLRDYNKQSSIYHNYFKIHRFFFQ